MAWHLQGAATGDYETAHVWGRLAMAMAERYADPVQSCRVVQGFAAHLNHWRLPLRADAAYQRDAFRLGVASGDLEYAAYSVAGLVLQTLLPSGESLGAILDEVEKALIFATRVKNRDITALLRALRQTIRCLSGQTAPPGSFEDEGFSEAQFLGQTGANSTFVCFYEILRLQEAYLLGDQRTARGFAVASASRLDFVLGCFNSADQVFYTALNLAALYPGGSELERSVWLREFDACQAQLEAWARHAPGNFRHKAALVVAERARIEGSDRETAVRLYGESSDGALAEGFCQDAALADELAGRYFLALGQRRIARMHLTSACVGYGRWGAAAKVAALERGFPEWMPPSPGSAGRAISSGERGKRAGSSGQAELDVMSLMKAAETLSGEMVLDRLMVKLLAVAIEAAGATLGVLLLKDDGGLVVRGRARPGSETPARLEWTPVAQCSDLPLGIIQDVWRTKESIVLDNPAVDARFADDPRAGASSRSVLCLPLSHFSSPIGILYLENDQLLGAFGPSRVEVLEALAIQMAIALDNARLHGEYVDLYDRAPCGYQALDPSGRFVRVNDTELDWLGYSREELVGIKSFGDLLTEERRRDFASALTTLKTQGWLRDAEFEAVRKDGSILPVLLDATAIQDAAGHFLMSRCIIADLTERKRAEADRFELLRKEQEARAELEAALKLDRLRRDFVNAISHDLRTPLTSILGYTEFLEDEVGGSLSTKQAEFVKQIEQGAHRLELLVSDLLDFARIEAGTFRLDLEVADLGSYAAEIAESMRPQAVQAGIELTVFGPETSVSTRMDRARIGRVLANLLNNALKFTPRGGRVNVAVCRSGANLVCEVSDTGCGISPEDIPRLFRKFSQLGTATSKGGTGLGLSICKTIVEAHGGTVGVKSEPGTGSTFWFELPVVE